MEKEFVTYDLALRMKQLGFDEPCLAVYRGGSLYGSGTSVNMYYSQGDWQLEKNSNYGGNIKQWVSAPTFSQAFRWFREKYQLHSYIDGAYPWFRFYINSEDDRWEGHKHLSHEEAELACLEKLIEIVEGIES